MVEKERRKSGEARIANALKRELRPAQQITLADLEGFGWELKFVRRPLFQEPVAVVFDPDHKRFAVLQEDGTLNENPGFDIRK